MEDCTTVRTRPGLAGEITDWVLNATGRTYKYIFLIRLKKSKLFLIELTHENINT